MDFEGIHRTPLWEQRRIGVAATILGALVAIVGMMIGFAIASFFGVSTRLFFLVAGWGSIMVGIGAYRVGISFFPFLAGTSRSASIARMFYVLVVMCVLGGSVLWFLLRDV